MVIRANRTGRKGGARSRVIRKAIAILGAPELARPIESWRRYVRGLAAAENRV